MAAQPSVAVCQEEIVEVEVHGVPDQAPEQVSSAAGSDANLHGRRASQRCGLLTWCCTRLGWWLDLQGPGSCALGSYGSMS